MPIDSLTYYAQSGTMTDLKKHADRLTDLPTSIPELCKLVQGVMIHIYWLDSYGFKMPPERDHEPQIRSAAKMLERIWEIDDRPLTVARPVDKRLFGTCRDFTTLLVALVRHQGIPARARCGFGTFFEKGKSIDHWQAEIWQADKNRWVLADAQLDKLQCKAMDVRFDPADISPGNFLTGGEAWQLCRARRADPKTFGIMEWWGWGFILGNAMRDLAALNKVELLPWDGWGVMLEIEGDDSITDEHKVLIDEVARLTAAGDRAFAEIRAALENNPLLCVPETVTSWVKGKPVKEVIAGS